jgi:hypothetical protein
MGTFNEPGGDSTQVISGHNTSLTRFRKSKDRFMRDINKEQGRIKEEQLEKERRLALKATQASSLLHLFLSYMG